MDAEEARCAAHQAYQVTKCFPPFQVSMAFMIQRNIERGKPARKKTLTAFILPQPERVLIPMAEWSAIV
eukprot:1157485-Pelagomonas_calceolata.AAC.7